MRVSGCGRLRPPEPTRGASCALPPAPRTRVRRNAALEGLLVTTARRQQRWHGGPPLPPISATEPTPARNKTKEDPPIPPPPNRQGQFSPRLVFLAARPLQMSLRVRGAKRSLRRTGLLRAWGLEPRGSSPAPTPCPQPRGPVPGGKSCSGVQDEGLSNE